MRVSNISFTGNLYLKNPKLWTESMKQAIAENNTIQETLKTKDVFGEISTKIERKEPPFNAYHEKGDTLYKVKFITKKENSTFYDKLKREDDTKKYPVTKHYHSEYTIVNEIKDICIE